MPCDGEPSAETMCWVSTASTTCVWTGFTLADLPISAVRHRFGITEKSPEAIAAGSVGPWEAGGISPFQLASGRTMAEHDGRAYASLWRKPARRELIASSRRAAGFRLIDRRRSEIDQAWTRSTNCGPSASSHAPVPCSRQMGCSCPSRKAALLG